MLKGNIAIGYVGPRYVCPVVVEMPRRGNRYIDRSNDVSVCLEARRSEVVLECAAASFAECKDNLRVSYCRGDIPMKISSLCQVS